MRRSDSGELGRRLLATGPSGLTDSELVRLLGATATLLARAGGLRSLANMEAAEMVVRFGAEQSLPTLAALELGRRALRCTETRPSLKTPADIYDYLAPVMSNLRREEFRVLCFNTRNILLRDVRVAEGMMDSCPVDPREVFSAALLARCTAIAVAHNHPSGDPRPSVNDIALTRQLSNGAAALRIRLLDHIIVGHGSYYSMLDHGDIRREL